jgi:hypothetical protein
MRLSILSVLFVFATSLAFADVCEEDGKVRVHVTQRKDGALGFVLYTKQGCYGIGPENFYSPATLTTVREDAESRLFGSSVSNGVKGIFGFLMIGAVVGDPNKIEAGNALNDLEKVSLKDTSADELLEKILAPKFLIPGKCEAPPAGMNVASYKAALAAALEKITPAPKIVAEEAPVKRAPAKMAPYSRSQVKKTAQGTSAAN